MIPGLILIAIGAIALLVKLGVLAGSIWGYTWPVILIILGLGFLWGRFSRRYGRNWGWDWCYWGRWPRRPEDEEQKR